MIDAVGRILLVVLAPTPSSLLGWLAGYVVNGVMQRTARRMRQDVEDEINRLSLGYSDRSSDLDRSWAPTSNPAHLCKLNLLGKLSHL